MSIINTLLLLKYFNLSVNQLHVSITTQQLAYPQLLANFSYFSLLSLVRFFFFYHVFITLRWQFQNMCPLRLFSYFNYFIG